MSASNFTSNFNCNTFDKMICNPTFVSVHLAVRSLSNQSDVEAVVKTLAPALMAELAKMKSSTSSPKGGKRSSSPPSASRKKLSTAASSSSSLSLAKKELTKVKPSLQKSETSSYARVRAYVYVNLLVEFCNNQSSVS